jgi:hypothetical protein
MEFAANKEVPLVGKSWAREWWGCGSAIIWMAYGNKIWNEEKLRNWNLFLMKQMKYGNKRMIWALWEGSWQLYERGLSKRERDNLEKSLSRKMILKYFSLFKKKKKKKKHSY